MEPKAFLIRGIIGCVYALLGFLAVSYDMSIFSREMWIIFDLIAIVVLGISYFNDELFFKFGIVVIFLICFNLFGPMLYNGEILPLVKYWPYAKINLIIGGIIIFTALG